MKGGKGRKDRWKEGRNASFTRLERDVDLDPGTSLLAPYTGLFQTFVDMSSPFLVPEVLSPKQVNHGKIKTSPKFQKNPAALVMGPRFGDWREGSLHDN